MRPPTPSESSRHSSPAFRPQTISSAPPSPYRERSQFILSHSDIPKRPRGMSRSSTFSAPTTSTSALVAKSPVASAITSEEFSPSGAFVPTRSASSSLRGMTSPSSERRGRLPFKWFKPKTSTSASSERSSSPASSVPSFSRTSSPDSVSTAATSAASISDVSGPSHLRVPEKQKKRRDSVLQAVEDTSALNISCACAACGKQGANFPRCPRCSETWCSRDCRMKSSGGRRHACRRATPTII
ncbi:hypothetical protein OE88DRAFT_1412233 [Heliocybe sulcata]|uniref:Uncharacterized protein n=1 Tax=Heliocybe sulcata TaxID=5364 RepID=A0A5C3N652_9AGAM|nr:hypothetical protein OE88DRAFT_1412233 [Heliocybe sulcata]